MRIFRRFHFLIASRELSLLVFISVYAAVSVVRRGGWFWNLFLVWHVVALSLCLVLLNMKWPVVLFIITLGLCPLLMSQRMAILKSASVMLAGAATYLMISVVLLRLVPAHEEASGTFSVEEASRIGKIPQSEIVDPAPTAPSLQPASTAQ
jgi:hypothetical protein